MSTSNELKIKSGIRDYSVLFVDDFAEALTEETRGRTFSIIDQAVFQLYKKSFDDIAASGRYMVIEAVEPHKTLDYAGAVLKTLIDRNIKRDDTLIAIGGGIIQDITGFIASILFRGISWSFYPTTLLAQADSCIGSKTSINVGEFKNQVGTFYPPQCIVLDVNFVKTLSTTDIRSGLGEIIKVHLLDGERSLDYLLTHYTRDSSDLSAFTDLIFRSLKIKKAIIERDEFDKDYRRLLNYGHTFGHAIESVTDYRVSHGQAVTYGMDIANFFSLKLGMLSPGLHARMTEAVKKNLSEFRVSKAHEEPLLVALSRDKKNVDQDLTAILTRGPGKMEQIKVPMDKRLREHLGDYIDSVSFGRG